MAAILSGEVAAAARLPKLGPVAGVSSLLAVLLAVYAFGLGGGGRWASEFPARDATGD